MGAVYHKGQAVQDFEAQADFRDRCSEETWEVQGDQLRGDSFRVDYSEKEAGDKVA